MNKNNILFNYIFFFLFSFIGMMSLCAIIYPNYLFFDYHISDLGSLYLKDGVTLNVYSWVFQFTLLFLSILSFVFSFFFFKNEYNFEGIIVFILGLSSIFVALPTDVYVLEHRLGAVFLFFSLWILVGKMFLKSSNYVLLLVTSFVNFIYVLFSFHILEGNTPMIQKISFITISINVIIFFLINFHKKR